MLQGSRVRQSPVREALESSTLGERLDARLRRLLQAIGQPAHIAEALRVAAVLGKSWRSELVSKGPCWPSDITDDHTPFEFSLALADPFDAAARTLGSRGIAAGGSGIGPARAVRLLMEPQDPVRPSLGASWALGMSTHEELASRWGTSLGRLEAIADVFEPRARDEASFAIWHSAVLGQPRGPEFKVYLNPAIHGSADAEIVLETALGRLGLRDLWAELRPLVLRRPGLDTLAFLSLDLTDTPDARVKVYVAHRHASARDVIDELCRFPGYEASAVELWLCRLMGSSGPFSNRPPLTCHALGASPARLGSTTLHLPVRAYLADDFEIARRICELLGPAQQVTFLRALTVVAERPLPADRGLQTYASLRATPGQEAMTIYLAPQLYTSGGSVSGGSVSSGSVSSGELERGEAR